MSRRHALLGAVAAAAVGAGIAALVDPGGPWVARSLLGGGVVAGELLELCPAERPPIPLSYAVLLVLVRDISVRDFALTIGVAELVALVLRAQPRAIVARVLLLAQRAGAAAAAYVCYGVIVGAHANPGGRWAVLLALAGAGLAELAVDELVRVTRAGHILVRWRDRSAELALVTSGMLMAVAYRGIDGRGAMGAWGPLLFSVLLLAAWYSFERLGGIRRTYRQTLRALSVVPELGGLVRPGHAERVADLSLALGSELGLDGRELEYLEAAALLHHLGHVCLDDPVVRGRPIEAAEVATATAAMLRETAYLAPASRFLTPEPSVVGGVGPAAMPVGAQILRVTSAFDELAEGDDARASAAIEALYSGPGYVYDTQVLAALERVVTRRARALADA